MIPHSRLQNPSQNEANSVGTTGSLYRTPWRLSCKRQSGVRGGELSSRDRRAQGKFLRELRRRSCPPAESVATAGSSHAQNRSHTSSWEYKLFVKQISARPDQRLTSSDRIPRVASPACAADTLLPRGAVPYLLDVARGYRRHRGRSSQDPTRKPTMPARLCRADSPPLHVIRVPASDNRAHRAAGLLRRQQRCRCGSAGPLFPAGTFRAAVFLRLLVLLKVQHVL